MWKTLFLLTALLSISYSFSQDNDSYKQHVLRFNIINPGIEYEHSISEMSKLSANIGFGTLMSYPNLTSFQASHSFFLSSFFDLHFKYIYNFNSRKNNKNIELNSGDFIGLKLSGRGKTKNQLLTRTNNSDFSIGPTWGIQRNYKKINSLFNFGPVYYFDTKGNSGFYPIMLEFNIGYNFLVNKK
jgi:hypothetical protein